MSATGAAAVNTLWWVSCLPGWRHFQYAAHHVERVQTRLLLDNLKNNQHADYGKRYGFGRIRTVSEYQRSVPFITYDDISQEIDAIGKGRPGVLTAEPVRLFEPSSGSTAATKLIPYTRTLKREFQRGLAPWIFDLFRHFPQLMYGPAFWSISPLTNGTRYTSGGIPIGFEDDSAYLGTFGKSLAGRAFAVPNEVKRISAIQDFRYATLLFLLREPYLRLISIWNPTYLILLLEALPKWWQQLLNDLDDGTLTPPGELDPELFATIQKKLRPVPRRATELSCLIPNDYQAIWPHLALISCWTDGPAADYAKTLSTIYYPDVALQGKGLIATEAFVSFPLTGLTGCVLAANAHFFEFLPVLHDQFPDLDQPRLAHQLQTGNVYAIVVTTGGGLYRYQLHDLVEVVGYYGQLPCLRFLGKSNQVSDWFGEKLNERFVTSVWEMLCLKYQLEPTFAMLAPEDKSLDFHYTLYLEMKGGVPADNQLQDLATDLDRALRRNIHYDQCRRLGQLAPVSIILTGPDSAQAYLKACQEKGQKLGDIKPMLLQKTTGWGHHFSTILKETGVETVT